MVIGKNSCLYQPGKNKLSVNTQDLQAINHKDFIFVDRQQSYQKTVDNYFREIGLSFYPQIHVLDSNTALNLAEKGLGNMSTCIEAVQNKKHHDLNFIKLSPEKVKIEFSVTTVKAEGNLSSEIKY